MIRFAAPLAAALFIASPALASGTAARQTPPATTPAPAGQGLAVADISAWLASNGGAVGPIQRDGDQTWFEVGDGPLRWRIYFYGCTGDVCADLQFSATFTNPAVTLERVNAWNQEHRFLKAFYIAPVEGGEPGAAVQYDVLIQPGQGVEQLADPASVWLSLVRTFAQQVGYLPAEGTAPAS